MGDVRKYSLHQWSKTWFTFIDIQYCSVIDAWVSNAPNAGYRKVKYDELAEHGPAFLAGTKFDKIHQKLEGSAILPDNYVKLAGNSAYHQDKDRDTQNNLLCTRSLYKRALEQDDPVRHLLYTFDLY